MKNTEQMTGQQTTTPDKPKARFFDVRVNAVIEKDNINVLETNVFPFDTIQDDGWYIDHVHEVSSRSTKKLGKYLLFAMNKDVQQAVGGLFQQKGMVNVNIKSLKISVTIKVTAIVDGEICAFSACSPFDKFKKSNGLKIANRRLVAAKKILANGIPGKLYTIWMVAQEGSPFTVVVP